MFEHERLSLISIFVKVNSLKNSLLSGVLTAFGVPLLCNTTETQEKTRVKKVKVSEQADLSIWRRKSDIEIFHWFEGRN